MIVNLCLSYSGNVKELRGKFFELFGDRVKIEKVTNRHAIGNLNGPLFVRVDFQRTSVRLSEDSLPADTLSKIKEDCLENLKKGHKGAKFEFSDGILYKISKEEQMTIDISGIVIEDMLQSLGGASMSVSSGSKSMHVHLTSVKED